MNDEDKLELFGIVMLSIFVVVDIFMIYHAHSLLMNAALWINGVLTGIAFFQYYGWRKNKMIRKRLENLQLR